MWREKRVFDWSAVESCLIGWRSSYASLCATPHHRTGQGRHLHDRGLSREQHWYCAHAHVLASQYCSAGFLAVMIVLLPFSWLTLLYASEALGLAFVAYNRKLAWCARCILRLHLAKVFPSFASSFSNLLFSFQSCQDSHGVVLAGHHRKTPTDWRNCVRLWSPTLRILGRRGCASAGILWLHCSRAPPAHPVCAGLCLHIVHPALRCNAVSIDTCGATRATPTCAKTSECLWQHARSCLWHCSCSLASSLRLHGCWRFFRCSPGCSCWWSLDTSSLVVCGRVCFAGQDIISQRGSRTDHEV